LHRRALVSVFNSTQPYCFVALDMHILVQSLQFKNSGKYCTGLSCRWALLTAWAIWFKLHLILHRVELIGGFSSRNWRIPGFYENKTQHWSLFFTKTNQCRFYYRKVLELSITWHKLSSELGRSLGLIVGF